MSSPRSSNAIRSIASYTRRNDPKSQLGPVNSGMSALSCAASRRVLSTDASFCKQFVKHREDLCRVADPPHREMWMRRRHFAIGPPQIAIARQPGQAAAHAVADLDIGEILAQRQHLAAEQCDTTAAVRAVVVTVGGLRTINVPAVGGIAGARDLQHLLERGRHHRAAGFAAVKERLLVDLLGRTGMADEHNVDMAVAPDQKNVKQHEEPLGEVLHRLGHRSRYVHQAEHDRFRVGPRHAVEAPIADIDRVDIGNDLAAPLANLELAGKPLRFLFLAAGARLFELLAQGLELGEFGASQRNAARHAVAHRARDAEVGWAAGDRVAGALEIDGSRILEALFDEVGQFEVLEEHIEEIVLRQRELERVLAAAVRAAFRTAAPLPAGRPRDLVAANIFLVAGNDVIGAAGAAVMMKDRLGDPARRDRNLLAVIDIGDLALAQRLLDGRFDLDAGAREEPLSVAEALAFRVGPAIDDVHRTISDRLVNPSRPCSPAYTTRPADAPAVRCSRARPSARRNRRASFRSPN